METTNDLNALLEEMRTDFQQKQSVVEAMPEIPPESSTEKRAKELRQKKFEATLNLAKAQKAKAEELLLQARTEKRRVNIEIGKLRFPDSTSIESACRAVGEQQIANALQLLSISQSEDVIINSMQSAINVGRIDFASTLLDKILAGVPNGYLTATEKPVLSEAFQPYGLHSKHLCLSLSDIYDSLGNREALEKLNNELKKVVDIETSLKVLIDAPMPLLEKVIKVKQKHGSVEKESIDETEEASQLIETDLTESTF